jgi:hypothetical protein
VPRSVVRALVVASALTVASLALSGCTTVPAAGTVGNCVGNISKVLLTDDSATKVATFSVSGVPKTFAVPSTPTPSCYYSSAEILPPQNGVVYTDTRRTLLYIGLSDSEVATVIASIRKTVSVTPWTVRFDYGAPVAPAASPTASPTATPTPAASTSSSARWYYNFAGGPSDDKGEMGYYASTPITQGTALQAGLSKPVNVLRIETELKQAKK